MFSNSAVIRPPAPCLKSTSSQHEDKRGANYYEEYVKRIRAARQHLTPHGLCPVDDIMPTIRHDVNQGESAVSTLLLLSDRGESRRRRREAIAVSQMIQLGEINWAALGHRRIQDIVEFPPLRGRQTPHYPPGRALRGPTFHHGAAT